MPFFCQVKRVAAKCDTKAVPNNVRTERKGKKESPVVDGGASERTDPNKRGREKKWDAACCSDDLL